MSEASAPAATVPPPTRASQVDTAPLVDLIGPKGTPRLSNDEDWFARAERCFKLPSNFRALSELQGAWVGQRFVIHGSGPSAEETFPEVLELVAGGAKLVAINAAHDWLLAKGLVPDFGVLGDPKDYVAGYQTPTEGVKYLLAGHVHDDTLKRFWRHPEVYIWHALRGNNQAEVDAWYPKFMELVNRYQRDVYCLAEHGSTTGICGWDLSCMLGAGHTHLVAMDSSSRVKADGAETLHAHAKPEVKPILDVPIFIRDPSNGREIDRAYRSNVPMMHQAMHWERILRRRLRQMEAGKHPPVEIIVHGSGLFPDAAALWGLHADPKRAEWVRSAGYRPEAGPPPLPASLRLSEIEALPDIR